MQTYSELLWPFVGGIFMAVIVGIIPRDIPALLIALTAAMTTLLLNISVRICNIEQKINKMEDKLL